MLPLVEKAKLLGSIINWRLHWKKHDLDFVPEGLNKSLFISARKAASIIPDRSTCMSSGLAGNARCSIFFWAIRNAFLKTGSPSGLTWVTVSAQGSRGKAPGTIEELDPVGLIDTYISGHLETAKSLLKQAENGHIELHTMPQGEMTFALKAQAQGETRIQSPTGLNTFLDPRTGKGSTVTPGAKKQYVSVSEENSDLLNYELPKIDVAMYSAPYADVEGNIYFKNAALITENIESTYAAKANGGKVLVAVSGIIDKNPGEIDIPAEYVDGIVVNKLNEQTGGVYQSKYWPMFTEGSETDVQQSISRVNFVNRVVKMSPRRGPVDDTLSRMAASVFTDVAKKGDLINLGTGMPEEVGRLIQKGGLYKDITMTAESGVYGGLPASGIFFGAAVNPQKIMSSAWMFEYYKKNLDVTVLGFLQVDSEGNVNVTKRGDKVSEYVGPGGFPTICEYSKTIIFVGSWMAKASMHINSGNLVINKKGIVKFVEKVDEVTFHAKSALKKGKKILYVTNVGIFKLTEKGMVLTHVAPGIDIKKDILDESRAEIIVEDISNVKTIDTSIMTGENYKLCLKK